MRYRLSLLAAAVAAVSSLPAAAAELPAIKISDKNRVPNCATPGRLMAYLQTRNGAMDGRFDAIATEYMRHGEQLRLRWDYAFFQMLVETGNLTFTGDVRPAQNNFAGLGATGKGEPGERFESVSKGVRAHLEHVLMYSGEPIAEPVAERTRKVQEWGILASWQKSIKGPMTYAHLTRKWSPGDRGYARDIAAIADKFFQTTCKQADPRPELVAEARKGLAVSVDTAAAIAPPAARPDGKPTGADIARKSVADAIATGETQRLALGAGALADTTLAKPDTTTSSATPPAYKIINAAVDTPAAGAEPAAQPPAASSPADGRIQTAALSGAAGVASAAKASPPKTAKCRVWTASYGGQRSVIIKAVAGDTTNYTVLDVNEGKEKRETEAYIAAYAKGGETVGEFKSQNQALDKAFNLCPEG